MQSDTDEHLFDKTQFIHGPSMAKCPGKKPWYIFDRC